MFDIKDKIVLITGAAGGIGASVVEILLEENVKHVIILDIDDKNGYALKEKLNTKYGSTKVKFIKCDLTKEQELLDAFKTVKNEYDYLDVVINNAAIADEKTFATEIEINFTALVRGSLQAWDFMRKDMGGNGGTIINVSSILAICSYPSAPIYGATKSAVLKFSASLGDPLNYCRTGVRVLTVCFGVTKTNLLSKSSSFDSVLEKMMLSDLDNFRMQTPEEAARGLTEIYKKGASGSVWIVTSGKPAHDATERYKQANEMFNDILLN